MSDVVRLRELLDYDADSGVFTWKQRNPDTRGNRIFNGKHAGKEAGNVTQIRGMQRKQIKVDEKKHYAHRLAWAIYYGEWPKDQIDHINHDPLDNRISNLRVVSNAENQKNLGIRRSNNGGVPGVSWSVPLRRWVAKIGVEGRTLHLGVSEDFFEACCLRLSANNKYGYHPNHGKPQPPQEPK